VYKTLAKAEKYCTAFGMNLFNIAQWHGRVARVAYPKRQATRSE